MGHVSRDATALAAPARPVPATAAPVPPPPPRPPGRPKKGEDRPAPPPPRRPPQPQRTLAENLADLPRRGARGCKQGSPGPPDAPVAIPLRPRTAERVPSLYDWMDAAYDAQAIPDEARRLGQGPILEPVQRGDWVPLDAAQRRR